MRFILKLILIATAILLISCEQEPTSIGDDLLPSEDFLNLIAVDSYSENWNQNSKSYQEDSLNLGRAQMLLLGQYSGVKSSALIKFFTFLSDSVYDALVADSLNVLSAEIELQITYELNEDSPDFGFTGHRINEYWQFNNFNKDSLDQLDVGTENIITSEIEVDSLIRFNIDTEVALGWLKARVDSNAAPDYGILLKPTDNTNKVYGFPASNGTVYGATPKLILVLEKENTFIDTTNDESETIIRDDVHIIEGTLPPVSDNKILLYAGLGGRGDLFVDLTSIPPKVIVNKATLELYIDSDETVYGSRLSDTLEVRAFSDSTSKDIEETVTRGWLYRSENKYSGEIFALIQKLVNGNENQGLRLRLTDETRSLSKVVIFGSTAADSLKPKLSIIYSDFN